MTFRTDSLYHRLTEEQRDELMVAIQEAPPRTDRFTAGLALCEKWEIASSRTAVFDFYKRYSFTWRLVRAASAAKLADTFATFTQEKRALLARKLFLEAADTDCEPRLLVQIRSLEVDEEKLRQREEELKLKRESLDHAKEKFKASLRTRLETAMEALSQEVRQNPKALAALRELQEALRG